MIQFKTATDKPEKFSFLYVADAKNSILELWARLICKGYKMVPDLSFIIIIRDLINRAHNETEWSEWFSAFCCIQST